MRPLQLALIVAAISGPVGVADWWYTYEASDGTFPEQQGWYRDTMGGGGQRSFEDGALVLDTSGGQAVADFYVKAMQSLPDPNDPAHAFVCEWSLRVDLTDSWNPEMFAGFQGHGDVALEYDMDRIYSLHEDKYVADFDAGVFHTYRLTTTDLKTYALAINGTVVYTGDVSPWCPASWVQFGDATTSSAGVSRWAFVRYGVVSALVGDVNCDGAVNFGDINPFVAVLTVPADMPGCGVMNADINQDGAVNFGDINPFVDLMLQVR